MKIINIVDKNKISKPPILGVEISWNDWGLENSESLTRAKKNLGKYLIKKKFIKMWNFQKNIQKKIPNYYLNELPNINNEVLAYSFKYLKDENKIRIENNNYYYQLLKNKKNIITLIPKENLKLVTLEFPILFKNNFYKTNFLEKIKKKKLDVRKDYYINCSNLAYLKKFKAKKFVNSEFMEENLICLPNNPKTNKIIIQEFSSCLT